MISSSRTGHRWELLGVAAFSFTVPFTRVAVDGGMDPLFVGSARALIAALLAVVALAATRQRPPRGAQWPRLAVVAGGVVVGFPVLTSFALTRVPAGHAAVVIALLPVATAVTAVLRGRERMPLRFWLAAGAGAIAATGFSLVRGDGLGAPRWADLLLLGAVAAAALGYAEGGLLARELGAWQTISWALLPAAPLMAVLTGVALARHPAAGGAAAWAAFAYLGVVSMYLGFLAWYRGLARGPMTQVSQIQLIQPVLNICWAALLLRERVTWAMALGGLAVVACAGVAVRVRLR